MRNLALAGEVEITVTGNRTVRRISTPVWFVHDGENLYPVPVQGTEYNWYRNMLADPTIELSAKRRRIIVSANPVRDPARISQMMIEKLRSTTGRTIPLRMR